MSIPVQATPEAEEQIREIDGWWRKNRLAAPDLFLDELSESFDLLSGAPQIGRLYRQSPVKGVRRLLLRRDALSHLLCHEAERGQSTGGLARTTWRRAPSPSDVTSGRSLQVNLRVGLDGAAEGGGFGGTVLVLLGFFDGLGWRHDPVQTLLVFHGT